MLTLMLLYVVFSLFMAAIALPLIYARIKPNGLYGFRVADTLNDPQVWYATNKHFGIRLLVVGVCQALASIGLALVPGLSLNAYALACLGVFVLLFAIAIRQSRRYMKSIARK